MDNQDREEVIACISGLEKMIEKLDKKGQQFYDHLTNEHGNIIDFDSFKIFFHNFLKKLPKQEITAEHGTEEEAQTIWNKIDFNKNEKLDSEESISVVREMLKYIIKLIKKYYKIENLL